MNAAAPTKSVLIVVYFALMILLATSAIAAFAHTGEVWKLLIALGIAFAKTALIFLIFMQLKYQRGLIRVFALAGFFWLGIIAVLTFADYLTRATG